MSVTIYHMTPPNSRSSIFMVTIWNHKICQKSVIYNNEYLLTDQPAAINNAMKINFSKLQSH
jgi:hypothetical protein